MKRCSRSACNGKHLELEVILSSKKKEKGHSEPFSGCYSRYSLRSEVSEEPIRVGDLVQEVTSNIRHRVIEVLENAMCHGRPQIRFEGDMFGNYCQANWRIVCE